MGSGKVRMLFSLTYIARATSLFLKYPSALPKLVNGRGAAANHIDEMRRSEYSKNQVTSKSTHGFTILLNPNDAVVSPMIATGWYEPAMTELFRHLVKKGMTVVDVGANMGWYTLLAARRVGDGGRVISIEPEPTNFSFLSKSVELNQFGHVRLLQECAAREEGTRTLFLELENLGGHSIVLSRGKGSILVRSTTLDATFQELGVKNVDVMKVDVEGADAEVLSGCKRHLSQVTNMMIEYTPESWASEPDLRDRIIDEFEVFEVINSPFLIRRITRQEFSLIHNVTNLYLRKAQTRRG
jgi:FkbM family methyltransferase